MIKNTNYFPHDFNARHDKKLVKLRLLMGMTGVGIYWSLVEMLYEQGGEVCLSDIDFIAKEWREKRKKIEEVVQNFELFENNSEVFWSESVNKRLNKIISKSVKATESATKRWDKDANALPPQSERNASKVKYSKVKESKVNIDIKMSPKVDVPVEFTMTFDEFKNAILEKEKKESPPELAAAPPKTYQAMMDTWNRFVISQTSCPAKIDGIEGKAMKSIIAYLKSASKEKTDEGVLISWEFLLGHWDKLDPFYKNNLKLSNINSNLVPIINQIKNNNAKPSQDPKQAIHERYFASQAG